MDWVYLMSFSALVAILSIFFAFITGWLNRKFLAHFQHRVGPYLAGPHGILQEFADFIKLMSKEVVEPKGSDSLLMDICPVIATAASLYGMLFIPYLGVQGILSFPGDLLLIIGLASLVSFLLLASSYASVGPFSSVGTGRFADQVISYDIPFTMSMIAAMIITGVTSLSGIVEFQKSMWIIVLNPIAFLVYIVGLLGETENLPFRTPVVETEIASGFEVEFSGRRLAFLRLCANLELLWFSLLGAVLFLGGPQPIIPGYEWLGIIWIALKALLIIFIVSLLESVFATYRIDQVLRIFWKWYMPLGILAIFISVIERFYVLPILS